MLSKRQEEKQGHFYMSQLWSPIPGQAGILGLGGHKPGEVRRRKAGGGPWVRVYVASQVANMWAGRVSRGPSGALVRGSI